ncbi:MAG: hypothetical protein JXR05_10350 [Flavobacteriaceae bacterium]
MKSIYSVLIVLLISSAAFSQQKKDTLTLEQQFDKIYRTSSSYQEYKVVGKTRYRSLQKGVLDSLKALRSDLVSKKQIIASKSDSIENLQKKVTTLDTNLKQTNTEKDSISLFGILISKSTYNIVLWSIIVILILALSYFVFKFKNSHVVTSEAKSNLKDAEDELATYKKKSLEREQKLRRQLQDEINKQRGV